jgi:DNA-directed RNA polymerase specialized sigma subunit
MSELVTKDAPDIAPEPDLDAEYKAWRAKPSPEASAHILDTLRPAIDRAAAAQVGNVNPIIRAKARTLALGALHTFNPERGRLVSHIYNAMQPLKRYVGQLGSGVHTPERLVFDKRTVTNATRELADELGRDPNDDELADRSGFSRKRLAAIRRANVAMPEGSIRAMGEASPEGDAISPAIRQEPGTSGLHIVYDELSPLDKRVMELSIGWNANPVLGTGEIAKRLRRSPGWVSQRKLVIQNQIDKLQDFAL